jgi:hypothetical protein
MKKVPGQGLLALGLLALVTAMASAQAPFRMAGGNTALPPTTVLQPQNSPLLSPYLNLLRGGNPAANYYLGVVPERARRANETQLGSNLNQLIPDVGRIIDDPLGTLNFQGDVPNLPAGPQVRALPSQGFGTSLPPQFGGGADVPRPRFGSGNPDARIYLGAMSLPPQRVSK